MRSDIHMSMVSVTMGEIRQQGYTSTTPKHLDDN
jgi:hypothetical protein